MQHNPSSATRRAFLRRTTGLAALGSAAPFALNLMAMNTAAAQSSGAGGYRAIVCVFLYGGNDHFNTVLPADDAGYAAYRSARGGIARERATLLPLQNTTNGPAIALPQEMAPLVPLYAQGKLAVVANVGPLLAPTNRADLQARRLPLPAKLFSHNDQQSTWQASAPEGAAFGWGGRIADLIASANGNGSFTAVSAAGNAVWLSGQATTQYQITSAGAVAIEAIRRDALFGSTRAPQLLQQMLTQERTQKLERDVVAVTRRSIDAERQVSQALAVAPALTTTFPSGGLAAQLRTVARLISARQALGQQRQVFFVSLGGFDHHAFLSGGHPPLLKEVADAMDAFYRATLELGVQDQVLSFTASDFGRALASNGDGSDHGWGGHHLVLGGAVRGGRLYGQLPPMGFGHDADAGQGRLIPTLAVDQYAATLAGFMGLSASQQAEVLPNLGRFGAAPAFA